MGRGERTFLVPTGSCRVYRNQNSEPQAKSARDDAPSQRYRDCAPPHSVLPLRVQKRVSFKNHHAKDEDGRTAAWDFLFDGYVEGKITREHQVLNELMTAYNWVWRLGKTWRRRRYREDLIYVGCGFRLDASLRGR